MQKDGSKEAIIKATEKMSKILNESGATPHQARAMIACIYFAYVLQPEHGALLEDKPPYPFVLEAPIIQKGKRSRLKRK